LIYNKIDANPEFITPSGDGAGVFAISALQRKGISALQAELAALAGKIRS